MTIPLESSSISASSQGIPSHNLRENHSTLLLDIAETERVPAYAADESEEFEACAEKDHGRTWRERYTSEADILFAVKMVQIHLMVKRIKEIPPATARRQCAAIGISCTCLFEMGDIMNF